jgi:serine/threonine protein kinase
MKKRSPKNKINPIHKKIRKCIIKIFNLHEKDFDRVICNYKKLYEASNTPREQDYDFSSKIACGTYGNIFQHNEAIIKTYKKLKIESIIEENMIHILLYCLQPTLKSCFGHPIPNCIPEIYQFVQKPVPMTIMEKVDDNLKHFLSKHFYNFTNEKELFIAIMYQLYFLQKTTYFIHRDLHSENIMLKYLKKRKSTDIIIENQKLTTLDMYFQIFFIDFGFSCLSLKKCGMDLPDIVSGTFYKSEVCLNRSHDARLLFASLYFSPNVVISKQLKDFLAPLFLEYRQNSNFNSYQYPTHFFYNDVIDYEDSRFFPENIIKNLLKI